MTAPATYVYCIVSSSRPLQTTTVTGLPGAGHVRAVEITPGRYLIVSDAPVEAFGEASLTAKLSDLDWVSRAAVAHEAVSQAFMAADAVVPMKLFTLFSSDTRALEQLRAGWKRVDGVIKRLTRHDEWGVRLVFDPSASLKSSAPAAPVASGRDYLLAKRQQNAASSQQATEMRKVAGDVIKSLRALSRDVKKRDVTAPAEGRGRLLLDAAFLVPRGKAQRFKKSVEARAKKIAASGYALQITGPWPPYSFVEG